MLRATDVPGQEKRHCRVAVNNVAVDVVVHNKIRSADSEGDDDEYFSQIQSPRPRPRRL